jgi:hypothetical protein
VIFISIQPIACSLFNVFVWVFCNCQEERQEREAAEAELLEHLDDDEEDEM